VVQASATAARVAEILAEPSKELEHA